MQKLLQRIEEELFEKKLEMSINLQKASYLDDASILLSSKVT